MYLKVFLLLLITIPVLSVSVKETEKEEFNELIFDKIKPSIEINTYEQYKEYILSSDSTCLQYFYKRSSKNSQTGAKVLVELAQKLSYLADILLFDCDTEYGKTRKNCEPSKDKDADVDVFPRIALLKPPEYRVNPYSGEFQQHDLVNEILFKNFNFISLHRYITKNIFTKSIKLDEDNIDSFLHQPHFNKIILFTVKSEAPILIRGLSNHYGDRILFGIINSKNEKLINKFKVKYIPSIMVYQSHEDNILVDNPKIGFYDQAFKDKQDIIRFIDLYALPEKRYIAERNGLKIDEPINFKVIDSDDYVVYFKKRFDKNIFVYFSADNKIPIPEDLIKFANSNCGYYFFAHFICKHSSNKDSKNSKNTNSDNDIDTCSREFNIHTLPALKLYNYNDILKNSQSHSQFAERINEGIDFPFETADKLELSLFQEFKNPNLLVANKTNLPKLIAQAKLNKKIPILNLAEGNGLNLALAILSNKKEFNEVFMFINIPSPDEVILKQLRITNLPQILTMAIPDKTHESDAQIQISTLQGDLNYINIKSFLTQFIREGNKTYYIDGEEVKYDKAELEYWNSSLELKENCIFNKKKFCLIAMLDGRIHKSEYFKTFERQIGVIDKLIEKYNGEPFSFGWVNATCHDEVLKQFNVDTDMIPNMIIYSPLKKAFTSLIGTFTEEVLGNYIDSVVKGKLPMHKIDAGKLDMRLRKCEEIKDIEDDGDDDEILKEIIAEERLKRENFEKERAKERKSEKTDKTDKKGKKKKKDL